MGKKPKDRHRRETQREAELALERERDLKRAARRQKAEAKLAAAGLAVGGPSASTASPSMEVEGPANPSLEPTLRKKGNSKRKVGKSDIDLAAVEGQRDDSQAAASRAIQAHEKADEARVPLRSE